MLDDACFEVPIRQWIPQNVTKLRGGNCGFVARLWNWRQMEGAWVGSLARLACLVRLGQLLLAHDFVHYTEGLRASHASVTW